ncbi:cobaltochelatase subunit CobN [Thiopseudomonas denitrificans]|uniref:Cobaltochelatase CobN subunit n=1 Tax=Thiopseudomonas denitrificans TaxID=1501432 RepID=A0A4R6TV44_9GAMM|nr:cobaltochelatase subunit CobN [Thiopseudomonas denitrificans]TDQ36522.1 cobaltochelatase CobN subunit [Thiopseudomonas denitrificans]
MKALTTLRQLVWKRLLLMVLLVLAGPLAGQHVAQAASANILVLAAMPVQSGKLERLKPLANQAGFNLEYRMLEGLEQPLTNSDLQGYDLLMLDAPYGASQATAQRVVAPLLEQHQEAWIWLRREGSIGKHLPSELIDQLGVYYSNGGKRNFAGFFCQLGNQLRNAADICAEPIIAPQAGIYHPDADGQFFADLPAYLQWREMELDQHQPVIALLFHRAYVDSGLTGFIDATIERIEAAGALALPLFTSAMESNEITRLVSMNNQPRANVLINMQIMLNAQGRKAEFEQLGIPVLQAMPYRSGDQADWEKDPQGLAPQDIPFYLAQPEFAGLIDPLFAAATQQSDGDIVPIDRQLQAAVDKAMRLVHLQQRPAAEIKTAIQFYNYPPGEKNLGASFMNVPRSLEHLLKEYAKRGYQVELRTEQQLIDELTALLAPFYRQALLSELLASDRAGRLPLETYQRWFASLPQDKQDAIVERWGQPQQAGLYLEQDEQQFFAIPRLLLGQQILMPQPPRGEREEDNERALYHDTKTAPSHSYLATFLWLREQANVDALISFGTHGTYEWQPGKERGLDVQDYPLMVLGDLPVIYPYIVDNIGEALQTKRRGRAVTVSHHTPSFGPAGLHGELNQLHELLHQWQSMTDGEVRNATATRIIDLTAELNIDKDLALDLTTAENNLAQLTDTLHLHLHDLALQQQPLGLAHFGQPAETDLRLFTVQQMLGMPLLEALFPEDPEELLVVDYKELGNSEPWKLLDQHVRYGKKYEGDTNLEALLAKGRDYWTMLGNQGELDGYFRVLGGRYQPTSYGGDPIKNPDSLPTGRNLYGFDPSRIPTREAWQAGQQAAQRLLEQHQAEQGAYPEKLAFSLWSVETMRHFGLLEAQALYLMGYQPVWDAGGRVTGIEVIPAEQLQRPRVDVIISATGLYRDQFPNVMQWMAQAADQASELDEPDNPIALNSVRLEQQFLAAGMSAQDARLAARTRIFSSESGAYGTGLDDATLVSNSFGETEGQGQDRAAGEEKLAKMYLDRMQYAYGPDSTRWGEKNDTNIYAEQLRGVQGAVLSRSSNLYGMLTTDDPFQYLGGIGLAVRYLDGKSPQLYISNLRDADNPRVETAAGFLARDLRARYLHPGWIEQVQKEGYSGALEVLGSANNLWGWQVTAPETVRDDQWDEYKAVYLDDKYELGINEWFEEHHPHAQAQLIERMLEAARKEYWSTDAVNLQQLAQRWQELAERYDVQSSNSQFNEYVAEAAAGFGLGARAPDADMATEPESAETPAETMEQVEGQRLEKQQDTVDAPPQPFDFMALFGFLAILAALAGGMWHQSRRLR